MHIENASIPRVRQLSRLVIGIVAFWDQCIQSPADFLGIRGIFATGFYRKDKKIRKWSYKQCHSQSLGLSKGRLAGSSLVCVMNIMG